MTTVEAFSVLCAGFAGLTSTPIWLCLVADSCPWLPQRRRAVVCAAVLMGALAGVGWRFAGDPAALAWWWAGWCSFGLAVTDVVDHRLPRSWVQAMGGGALWVFVVLAAIRADPAPLVRALAAGAVVWLLLRVVEAVCAGAMGTGDTRLQAVLAVLTGWIGWYAVLSALVLGTLLLGCTAGLTWAVGRRGWTARLPAGPSLLAGAWFSIFLVSS